MIVVDLIPELAAAAQCPSTAALLRERARVAILELVRARRALFGADPRTATEFDLALVRLLFGNGGTA